VRSEGSYDIVRSNAPTDGGFDNPAIFTSVEIVAPAETGADGGIRVTVIAPAEAMTPANTRNRNKRRQLLTMSSEQQDQPHPLALRDCNVKIVPHSIKPGRDGTIQSFIDEI
jgi:hypothetical protein